MGGRGPAWAMWSQVLVGVSSAGASSKGSSSFLGRSGEHALVHESLEGVLLLVVPVVVQRLPQVRKELLKDPLPSGQLLQAPSSVDPQ